MNIKGLDEISISFNKMLEILQFEKYKDDLLNVDDDKLKQYFNFAKSFIQNGFLEECKKDEYNKSINAIHNKMDIAIQFANENYKNPKNIFNKFTYILYDYEAYWKKDEG